MQIGSVRFPILVLIMGGALSLCLVCCAGVFITSAIGGALDGTSTQVAEQVRTPTPVAVPATQVPSRKVGLGSTLADWERVQGAPNRDLGLFKNYRNDTLSILVVEGRPIAHVEKSYRDPGVALALAKSDATELYPDDAVFVRTYAGPAGSTVELYKSASLVTLMPDEEWMGGDPGDFIVIYRQPSGTERVTSIVVATGNNP